MAFHAYLLRCSDGSFYAGHSDDIESRIAAYHAGTIPGYAQGRRPLVLAWAESFGTLDEALAAERRIKGWSRAKKQALIDGDWDRLRTLARNRQDDG